MLTNGIPHEFGHCRSSSKGCLAEPFMQLRRKPNWHSNQSVRGLEDHGIMISHATP